MSSTLNSVLKEDESTEEELSFFELAQTPKKVTQKKKQKEVEPTQEELDFFELQSPYQQDPIQEDTGYWKSLLNSVPRGLIDGVIRFGRTLGPLPDQPDMFSPEGEVVKGEKYDHEKIAALLDEWFPTDDEFLPNVIKEAGKVLPTALAVPSLGVGAGPSVLSNVTRAVAGGALGEGAKEVGLPEWAQTIAEIAPWLTPNLSAVNQESPSIGGALAKLEQSTPGWAKKLVSKYGPKFLKKPMEELIESGASRKETLEFARSAGMKEAEIAPLLQGEMKQKLLSKLASKGESTQSKLRATQKSIGNVFNSIKESPSAQKVFTERQSTKLVKGLQDRFEQMPASVRSVVQDDFQQLLKGDMTGEKVIKFFRDINHELGSKTKQLSTLKDPIKKSLMEIDSELGRSFDMTNKLYGKYSEIAKRLKPSEHDKLYAAGKGGMALSSLLTGNFGVIKLLATYEGARKLSEHMLTNPRLQNLSTKMISALNQNKFQVAEHIKRQMIDEVKEVDPRVAKALQELNIKSAIESE